MKKLFVAITFCLAFNANTIFAQTPSPEDYYHQASAYYDAANFKMAISYYSEVIKQTQDYTSAYFNRGLAYYNLGKYHKALYDFSQVIQRNANDIEAYENRARTRFVLNDFLGAIDDYDAAISIAPSAMLFANRGLAKKLIGRKEEALLDYQSAIKIDPNDAETYSNIGDVFFEKERYEDAIQYYNKALSLNPNDELSLNNRANAYNKMGNPDEALASYNEAVKLQPDAEILANRGYLKLTYGIDGEANTDCLNALKLDGKNARAYSCVALVRLRQGDFAKAIELFDISIELGDQSADTYNSRGMARHLGGYYHDALLDFNRAVGIDATYSDAFSNRGATKFMLGDFHGAIADQNEAIKFNDQNAIAYTRLETCYTALKKLEQQQLTPKGYSQTSNANEFGFIRKVTERLEWQEN